MGLPSLVGGAWGMTPAGCCLCRKSAPHLRVLAETTGYVIFLLFQLPSLENVVVPAQSNPEEQPPLATSCPSMQQRVGPTFLRPALECLHLSGQLDLDFAKCAELGLCFVRALFYGPFGSAVQSAPDKVRSEEQPCSRKRSS